MQSRPSLILRTTGRTTNTNSTQNSTYLELEYLQQSLSAEHPPSKTRAEIVFSSSILKGTLPVDNLPNDFQAVYLVRGMRVQDDNSSSSIQDTVNS